ncbi:DUF6239 family natural product biosynthesis protein [Actinophytocola sp.]|uniref:DUF6239 family natural product biosynthesis protein n=1 Tax=Actinophytocola sp. TaxID=1872138 RepID=UPI002D7E7F3C|nr:DUF6239 family natural product biosynthesis protein [Actinophytocola sp.]HET9140811.1 DUF6239 family natural product biosynthesis protein [Actinophytocola sp.]
MLLRQQQIWALTQPGHDHVLQVPITIGPLVLRVGLLIAVPLVAGFAMLRGFLPEPGRTVAALVAGSATVAAVLELILADGLDLPRQAVPLLLVALAAPMFLVLSRDPRFEVGRAVVRRLAPWVFSATALLAFVEFARAFGAGGVLPVLLRSGVVYALVALAWFTVWRPAGRRVRLLVHIEAAVLANAALAASAYGLVLTLPLLSAT